MSKALAPVAPRPATPEAGAARRARREEEATGAIAGMPRFLAGSFAASALPHPGASDRATAPNAFGAALLAGAPARADTRTRTRAEVAAAGAPARTVRAPAANAVAPPPHVAAAGTQAEAEAAADCAADAATRASAGPPPDDAGDSRAVATGTQAEAAADRVADGAMRASAFATPSPGEKLDARSAAAAPRERPMAARSGGEPLGRLRAPLERIAGVDLGGVRVHRAPRLARALGARAFTRGGDIFVAGAVGDRVLAHEAVHVAQQFRAGRVALQRWSDPTQTSLDPADLATWGDEDVLEGIDLLVPHLAALANDDPARDSGIENLRLLIDQAAMRRVAIPPGTLTRLPASPRLADAETLFRLNAALDLIAAMVERDFPLDAPFVIERLDGFRRLYPWLDAAGLAEAQNALDEAVAAVGTAARIKRLAVDPGGDAAVSAAIDHLDETLSWLLDALLTPDLAVEVAEVEMARDDWLHTTADAFIRTASDVRESIADAIDPNGYGMFSNGIYAEGVFVLGGQWETISALDVRRENVVAALDALIDEAPGNTAELEERIGYVVAQSQRLEHLLVQAESIDIARKLLQQGQVLADMVWNSGVPGQQANRENMIELRHVASTLAKFTGEVASREALDRLRSSAEAAFADAGARAQEIADADARVAWFVGIATTLLGIGAMRTVMALPRVAALGRTGAGIVGSLAFTGTRLVLTKNQGRPWSVGGVAEEAAKDYLLLRLLGGVDARIVARLGDVGTLAAAARLGGAYGVLATWALVWNAIDPAHVSPTGAPGGSTGDILVQTAVDLAVLTIAEAMLRAPAIPSTELAPPGGGGPSRAEVLRQWQALQTELRTTGEQLREWQRSGRGDAAAGDALLGRTLELFARTKSFFARFETLGEVSAEQRTALEGWTDGMLESVRNARDEVRLDIRPGTADTWTYRGDVENVATYLARLQAQGRVAEVAAEKGGVFFVRTADGTMQWFYPASRTAPVVVDMVGESVANAAPNVPPATRDTALVHLRGAGWSELATFAGSLRPGSAEAFIRWVARAEVGEVLAEGGLPFPLVRELARAPRQLEAITGVGPHHIKLWYAAWAARHPQGQPGSQPGDFLATFRDVLEWRGTGEVADVTQAGALLARRESAAQPATVELVPARGAQMFAAGTPTPVYSEPLLGAMRDEIQSGARYSTVTVGGRQWVFERFDAGIERLLEIGADNTVVRRVPVAERVATLGEVLTAVRNATDEASAHAELARADEALADLDVLLDLRSDIPPAQIYLIDQLLHHPLRAGPAASVAPPPEGAQVCDPNDPLAALPPELVAVANALPVEVQQALEATAAWSARRVEEMLRSPIMIAAFRGDPASATVFLRTLVETRGLPLYEPHLHGRGAMRYARRMALDVVEATAATRANTLANRLAFGDAVAALLDAPGFPTANQWATLRPELEALGARLGTTPAGRVAPALRADAERLGVRIEAALHLGIERAAEPQLQRFFQLYRLLTGVPRPTFRSEGLPAILTDLAASGTGGLEIRTGDPIPSPDPILGGTRRIASIPGGILNNADRARQQQNLQTVYDLLADPNVIALDKSGEERSGQRLGVMVDASFAVHVENFQLLANWLGARPNTAAAVQRVLGYDPLGAVPVSMLQAVLLEQVARFDAILSDTAPLPADRPTVPLDEFAAQIRRMRDAIARVGAEAAQYPGVEAELASGAMPAGLRGITIHAGEQVASGEITLAELLGNVEDAIAAGTDRIGHATILGIRFPADLGLLGFRIQANGDWVRTVAAENGGTVTQRITPAQMPALEARRVAALARVAELGIAVEVPPTSNIVLAGLPPLRHPVGTMLADQPDLRVVAATDNPAIHRTDLATETAFLAASAGMGLPRRTVLYLEGYASRLGSRPLENVPALSDYLADSIVANTPAGDRLAVLEAVYARWPVGAPPGAADTADAAAFEAAIRRILRGIVY
jgi:hypothetical protein